MMSKRELRKRWEVEPGLTIRRQIIEFERTLEVGHGRKSDELFHLLDGLPYREEVTSGRDFRGINFIRGREMDFSDADFSYSTNVGDFFYCNLTNARFDELVAERSSFENVLNNASFRKAKLRSCYIQHAAAKNCCFDDANIYHMSFKGTDLSGSTFRNTNCKGVSFDRTNLLGCDFSGANLEEAVFADAIIDKSTDFRGAFLVNVFHNDDYDNAGNLLSRGVDLRQATYDSSTRFGDDALAFPLEIDDLAIQIATEQYGSDGQRIAAFVRRMKEETITRGEQSLDWENEQIAKLNPQDRALYEEIMDETFRSLR